MANELFEIQTKTCINNSLQTIDLLLDQDPTQGRDGMIHEQVRLIKELVGLTRYVRTRLVNACTMGAARDYKP